MLGDDRSAVIVVARIGPLDVEVGLRRQRTDYVRQRIISQPCQAVVVGLARPHPVTGNARVTISAVGALARVIPRRQEGAGRADRKVGLPLRTGGGISVQLERRAKGDTAVGGADVIDVARVTAGAVLGIDQVNYVVEGRRLTPALVPPVAAVIGRHAGKIPDSCHARSGKAGTDVGIGPGGAAVSGLEDVVGVVVGEASAAFVHAGNVHDPVARQVTRDLHVANEVRAKVQLCRAAPGSTVV